MAEATQATTTTTEVPAVGATTVTTPPITTPDAATATALAEVDLGGAPAKRLTAQQRADAAIAKAEAPDKAKGEPLKEPEKPAEAAKPAEDKDKKPNVTAKEPAAEEKAKTEAEAKAKTEADEKAKAEEAAKKEPRLSRAMAIVAERERAVANRERAATAQSAEQRRAFEADRLAFESSKSIDSEDLTFVRRVREVARSQGKVAAAQLFGFSIPELVEAKSREAEPSAEDIARRVLREENELRERAAKEAQAAEDARKTQDAERAKAAETVEATEFVSRVVDEHQADKTKRPWLAHTPVTGQQIWDMAKAMRDQLGRHPTETEVLDAAEKVFVDRYGVFPSPVATTSPAPAAATVAPAGEPEKPKQQEQKPAEQPRRRPTKRETPMARVAAILRSRGIDR